MKEKANIKTVSMLDEKIILAFFIKVNKIESFISFIKKKYNIEKNDIYLYNVQGNNDEYLITFRFDKCDKFLEHKDYGKPIHIHVKYSCLFSINALNKYIELNNEDIEKGNFNYKQFKIDWDKLKNKLLLIKNNNLKIDTLVKVKDLAKYFVNNDIYNK